MKTIAVSIDEPTLDALDRLAARRLAAPAAPTSSRSHLASRSSLVREALHAYIIREERAVREAKERAVFARHRERVGIQAAALVAEQAER